MLVTARAVKRCTQKTFVFMLECRKNGVKMVDYENLLRMPFQQEVIG